MKLLGGILVGELDRFDGIIIRIYPEKGERHSIPHIHIYYNEHNVLYQFLMGKYWKADYQINKN